MTFAWLKNLFRRRPVEPSDVVLIATFDDDEFPPVAAETMPEMLAALIDFGFCLNPDLKELPALTLWQNIQIFHNDSWEPAGRLWLVPTQKLDGASVVSYTVSVKELYEECHHDNKAGSVSRRGREPSGTGSGR